jgi:hypothetical protein
MPAAFAVTRLLRSLLLVRLQQVERLSESFMQNILTWVLPGISVYAGSPVHAAKIAFVETQARYITPPALGMNALRKHEDGSLVAETPPETSTGATSITRDPL